MSTARARPVFAPLAGWLFGLLMLAVGLANLVLVHPAPAAGYLLAALVYLPPVRRFAAYRWALSIHPLLRIVLGVALVMFTLGVSDLGEMLDRAGNG